MQQNIYVVARPGRPLPGKGAAFQPASAPGPPSSPCRRQISRAGLGRVVFTKNVNYLAISLKTVSTNVNLLLIVDLCWS